MAEVVEATPLTDLDLVRRAAAGEERAVDAIFAYLRKRLLSYARARLGTYPMGEEIARDATQNAMLAIAVSLPSFEPRDSWSFSAWVFTIARNHVADAQRGALRQFWEVTDTLPEVKDSMASPEDVLVEQARETSDRALLDWLLGTLPRKKVRVLRLQLEGHTDVQIGEALGVSTSTVRVYRHRAILAMRHVAQQQGLTRYDS